MNYEAELDDLIMTLIKEKGSDIHFKVDYFPTIRINRELIPLTKKKELTGDDVLAFLTLMISEKMLTKFVVKQELSFSYIHRKEYRMRGNCAFESGFIAVTLRFIPLRVKTIEELGLPKQLINISRERQGFFLVAGSIGQGKSTTLAAIIEFINQETKKHILTIEDPIEFHFSQDRSIIGQREVGTDTASFHDAMVNALRQDVDVIMLGEMRDEETMSTAMTAAETGHLVLSTIHTNSAAATIDRIVDSFPGERQNQVRVQLASTLIGVLSQQLVPGISGGMVPAFELLLNTGAVANLIRLQRTNEIDNIIETSAAEGMIDLDRYLAGLVKSGLITKESAYQFVHRRTLFDRLL